MSAEFYGECQRILSAVANGLYQGIFVALLAGVALRFSPRTNAATRHAVWLAVLLFVAALIPAHVFLSCAPRRDMPSPASGSEGNWSAVPQAERDSGTTESRSSALIPGPSAEISEVPSGADFQGSTGGQGIMPGSACLRADGTSPVIARANPARSSQGPISSVRLPHWICLCLLSAWIGFALIRMTKIIFRACEVRRIKQASETPGEKLQALFDKLRGSLAARRTVGLRISSSHRMAVVLGFVHPVVLLPAEMVEDANDKEVEHVLRHELAHVERRDDWSNLAQQFLEAVLFFHPAIWWISSRLCLEREIACDDHVLEAKAMPRDYALTLANAASRLNQGRLLLAPGVSNNNSQLQQRIVMILNTRRNRSARPARRWMGLFATATALAALVIIDAGPRLVLAEPPDQPPAEASDDSTTPPALPPDSSGPESAPREKQSGADNNSPVAIYSSSGDARTLQLPAPATVVRLTAVPAAPAPVAAFASSAPASVPATPSIPSIAALSAAPAMQVVGFGNASFASGAAGAAPGRPSYAIAGPTVDGGMTVEERLERVERILEDLQVRDGKRNKFTYVNPKAATTGAEGSAGGTHGFSYNMETPPKRDFDQAERAIEQARREVEAAHRAQEMATKEKAFQDSSNNFERLKNEFRLKAVGAKQNELEALRTARQSLQAEVNKLERQIKRMEEDQKRANDPGANDGPRIKSLPQDAQPGLQTR